MTMLMGQPAATPQSHPANHPGVNATAPTPAIANLQFRVSINRRWPAQKLGLSPVEKRWAKYNSSFRAEEHTPESLLREVS